ncbi:MAG: hypothetical protein ACFFD2_09465 [Promethearchaeota archaeon]
MDHFQEKLRYYFSRYAFDEYYPLNSEEMDEYENWCAEIIYVNLNYRV